eukprot:COSAG05_NODE_1691_length_4270_cov_18.267801_1_plen_156_part_00
MPLSRAAAFAAAQSPSLAFRPQQLLTVRPRAASPRQKGSRLTGRSVTAPPDPRMSTRCHSRSRSEPRCRPRFPRPQRRSQMLRERGGVFRSHNYARVSVALRGRRRALYRYLPHRMMNGPGPSFSQYVLKLYRHRGSRAVREQRRMGARMTSASC